MILEYINTVVDLYTANPIAQISGFIWMIFVWIAFLNKDDLITIKFLFIANFFWWIQFLLLESYAGLVAIIISVLRLYFSMKYKKNIKVFSFIIALIIITWIIVYDWYFSLLPILWSFIWAYSFFFFSGIALRIWCLFISIVWLIYNIHIWSIWWVINEVVVEMLIIITLYQYIWINWYRLIFISKIKSIFHPYKDIDYWRYTIVKDKNTISKKINLKMNFKNLNYFKNHNLKMDFKNFVNNIINK